VVGVTARELIDALDRARGDASNARALWPSEGLALPCIERCIVELERLLLAVSDGPDPLAEDGRPAWW
jgi:hypothetical protein